MSPPMKLSKLDCQLPEDDRTKRYREIAGALLRLEINTRPDLSYAVNQLSKHLNNPGMEHWYAIEQVLRYLKGTSDYGLCYDVSTGD